jgi:ATPase family associated with various cellular activities (AAA)
LPDAARPLLVSMMRRYLLDAVAPTFFRAPMNDPPANSGAKLFDGWQDDHTVGTETTVGWATAIICHFLANFSQVLDDWINRRIIEDLHLELATEGYLIDDVVGKPAERWQRDFGKPNPREVEPKEKGEAAGKASKRIKLDRRTGEVWPDLPPHAWAREKADEGELAKAIFENWTDPSLGCAISKGIARVALVPILSAPDQRPGKDRYAGLMLGQPGTRKTSLVDRIAKTIHWPKIAVPASLIFAKGFDQIEAQANEVFDRLNHLRRCVIFFDEFEEFFVSRKPEQGLETSDTSYKMRTIAAFTTSAMLPRLQQLHDKQRCLIFLATNHPEKMDAAIKRRGRFDFQIEVNHPTAQRLVEYLKDMPTKSEEFAGLEMIIGAQEGVDALRGFPHVVVSLACSIILLVILSWTIELRKVFVNFVAHHVGAWARRPALRGIERQRRWSCERDAHQCY